MRGGSRFTAAAQGGGGAGRRRRSGAMKNGAGAYAPAP